MKKELLIVLLSILTTVSFSQDVLLFQDGSKKDAKILEISPEIVKYKKYNSSSEVVYTEDKYNLIGVIFEDGEFEKFESSKSNYSKSSYSDLRDYGSNMFSFNILSPFWGVIDLDYEHFSKKTHASIRIPFLIDLTNGDPATFDTRENLKIGFEHKFFPTGSNGVSKGFIGYAVHLGIMSGEVYAATAFDSNGDGYDDSSYISYSSFFNDVQLIGGVQFHPSKVINITLDVGIGPGFLLGGPIYSHGYYNTYYNEIRISPTYFSWDASINLGFRF